jgi:uncharacterized membrane protein
MVSLLKMGAPLHPIFVHFTIALTGTSLAFDMMGSFFGVASLVTAGGWALAGSLLMTIFTIPTGITSRRRWPVEEGEARSFLRAHMALGPIFFGLLIAAGVWRAALWQAGQSPTWWYLLAMTAIVLVMTAQGYLGGELVYRYGAEVGGAYRKLPGRRPQSSAPSLIRSPRGVRRSPDSGQSGEMA